MFSNWNSSAMRSGVRSTFVSIGLLYIMMGSPTSFILVKCAITSEGFARKIVGGNARTPSAPSCFASSAHFTAWCQPTPCTPATTRPRSPTVSTATWMTRRRSSSVRLEYSPSDPFGPTPPHPLFMRKPQCAANRSWSTASPAGVCASSLNARVVATMTPPRSNFLVMRAVLSGQIMVSRWVDVAGWPDGALGERGVGADRRGVDPDGTEGAADGTEGAADGTEGAADGTEGLADGTEGLADGDGGIAASSARRTGVVIGRRSETATGTGAGSDIRV